VKISKKGEPRSFIAVLFSTAPLKIRMLQMNRVAHIDVADSVIWRSKIKKNA